MMYRCSLFVMILSIGFAGGCSSNGGWCGYNQPQYPIGTYPYQQGYPGQVAPIYPGTYAQPGTFGNTTTANSPPIGTMNPATGAPMGGVQYSQPLPGGYPMGAYPGAMPSNMGGVPLNQFNPNQPFLGR